MPSAFEWRGTRYEVRDVIGRWRIEGRWWADGRDREYWRVEARGGAVWDLYFDRAARRVAHGAAVGLAWPRDRHPGAPVPGLRAAAARGRAGAPGGRVVALVRARGRAPRRGLPVRQRGGDRQRRGGVDLHAARAADRGRARCGRDLARRRDRRRELSPALRPQRAERPAHRDADLRPAHRVGDGARARLHGARVDRRAGTRLRGARRRGRGRARVCGWSRRPDTPRGTSRS